jgi:mono/diheme cytochrome c family protein
MKLHIAVLVLAAAWVAAAASSVAQTPRSVNDGVFTAEQAKRGEATFMQDCSPCHGADLNGDGFAPPLAGADFSSNWNDLSVGDLFERIRVSMPPDGPGKVSDQSKADIIAFLLDANKYPAGTTELEPKTEVLKQIKIELKK